jgi:hypothetical protein
LPEPAKGASTGPSSSGGGGGSAKSADSKVLSATSIMPRSGKIRGKRWELWVRVFMVIGMKSAKSASRWVGCGIILANYESWRNGEEDKRTKDSIPAMRVV